MTRHKNIKKICVIGANGFLGQNLIQKLPKGCLLTLVSRSEIVFLPKNARHIKMDFKSWDCLHAIPESQDIIFFLLPQVNDREFIAESFTEWMLVYQLSARLIFASSGGTIYGEQDNLPILETATCHPLSAYAQEKLFFEEQIRKHQIDHVILRIANPYGPYQTGQLISNAMQAARDNSPLTIYGDGSAVRDYIYVDDVVQSFLKAMNCAADQILNIASGQGRSTLHVIRDIEKVTGVKISLEQLPARKGDVAANILDISCAKRILDWQPQISWQEGLERMWQWMSSQQL